MSWLVDSNVLLRLAQPGSPDCDLAIAALGKLRERGESVFATAQNFIEFWCVATRPKEQNGLGFAASEAEIEMSRLEAFFRFVPESGAVFDKWKEVVGRYGVCGVKVHDARLAAVMLVNGLSHVLTFNISDFSRFSEIAAVHPGALGDEVAKS